MKKSQGGKENCVGASGTDPDSGEWDVGDLDWGLQFLEEYAGCR